MDRPARGRRLRPRAWLWLWLCWALLAGPAAWAAAPLRLQADTDRVDVPPVALRWIDATAQAGLDEAQRRLAAGDFKPVAATGSAGFTRAAHWYTATLERAAGAGERWVLAIGEPYLDDVQVWWQRGDGGLQRVHMGDRHLADGRPLRGRQHAVGLVVPEAASGAGPLRLWVRVRSTSAMNVTIELWRPDAYFDHESQAIAGWGVVIGLLLLAAVTQLIFGLWLRDAVMITFAAYLGALSSVYAGLSGMALLALARPPARYGDLLVGAGNLGALALGSLLALLTLEVRRHLRPAQWLYLVPAALALLALPLVVTDQYGAVAVAVNLWGMALSLFNMGLSLWVWRRQRDRERLVYMLACWCMGAGLVLRVLSLLGLVPTGGLAGLAYQGGAVAYLLLMLLAMGIRLASLRHDKLLAQERVTEERRFAAIVAHEFRNPLAGIDRSANLLQLVPDLTPAQTAQRLSGIRRQVGRLSTLVDSFLNAEAGETRPLRVAPDPVALAPWLQALRAELDDDARARLHLSVEPEALQARFDAGLLALALHNLVDNALRYSPVDRPVQLQARRADADGALELVVTDQGPGLSAEDLQHLGRPYRRGATAVGRQGTGLGYYFCQRIVQMHGGQVQAANVPPLGLGVTLRLPQAG